MKEAAPPWEAMFLGPLEAWALVAVAAGVPIALLWRSSRAARGPLLPAQRQRAVPWGVVEIGLILYLGLMWELFAAALVARLMPGAGKAAADLSQFLIGRALQTATAVALLRWLTRARAYQFGLGTPAWPRDLTIGYLGWLVATPAVFLIFAALLAVLEACGQHPNLQHPIETMLRTTADPAVWALAVVSATVAAPVVEELVFRGLLLRWLTDRRAVADGLLVVLLLAIATVGLAGVMNGRESAKPVLALLMPVGPGYLLFERLTARRLPRPGAARAIYVTALAFALIHDWPTPVPLFFLGLALGFVGYRTQGLIAPVVLHSLFNAVSVLGILLDLARKAAG